MLKRAISSGLFSLGCFALFGCGNGNNTHTENQTTKSDSAYVETQKQAPEKAGVPCDTLLIQLIKSSNVSEEIKKLTIVSDGLSDSILHIRIYHLNDVNFEVVWANLELNTKDRKLYDMAVEDSPKIVTCDTQILNNLLNNCIDWSDNNN